MSWTTVLGVALLGWLTVALVVGSLVGHGIAMGAAGASD